MCHYRMGNGCNGDFLGDPAGTKAGHYSVTTGVWVGDPQRTFAHLARSKRHISQSRDEMGLRIFAVVYLIVPREMKKLQCTRCHCQRKVQRRDHFLCSFFFVLFWKDDGGRKGRVGIRFITFRTWTWWTLKTTWLSTTYSDFSTSHDFKEHLRCMLHLTQLE